MKISSHIKTISTFVLALGIMLAPTSVFATGGGLVGEDGGWSSSSTSSSSTSSPSPTSSTSSPTTTPSTQTTPTGCSISNFTASPSFIGAGDFTNLIWNTNNCTAVSITSQNGGDFPSVQVNGSQQTPALSSSVTYTLTARNISNILTSRSITVVVGSQSNGSGCSINSFTASPSQVAKGDSTTLTWDTYGCNSLTISGGQLASYQFAPSGSVVAPNLTTTTTYTLYANGQTSTTKSVTVSVTGGTGAYTPTCSDGIDNDGDGKTDYPADTDCTSASSNGEGSTANSSSSTASAKVQVFTTVATNIGPSNARLNGLVTSTNGVPPVSYFEYGTNSKTLETATTYQYITAGKEVNYYQTVSVAPSTTYFWRAVARSGDTLVRGSINSFTTPEATSSGNITSFIGGGSGDKTNGTGASATDGVAVSVKDQSDNLSVGDTVEYTITYTNGSGMALSNATLVVTLPQGFTLKQGTQGQIVSASTFQSTIGSIAAGGTGSVFIEAVIDQNAPRNQTLVTNATLSFTLPSKVQDSAVGYVLNHIGNSSSIGGLAIGAGFFPTTIFGWFMTILVILILILVVRRVVRGSAPAHADHGGHH